MAETEYEILTHVFRDVLAPEISHIKDGRFNLVVQETRLIEPPKPPEPEVAMKSKMRFSVNGSFIYENSEGQISKPC